MDKMFYNLLFKQEVVAASVTSRVSSKVSQSSMRLVSEIK
jgi:hypothetical protein